MSNMAPLLYRGRTGGPGAVRFLYLVAGGLVLGPVVPRFVQRVAVAVVPRWFPLGPRGASCCSPSLGLMGPSVAVVGGVGRGWSPPARAAPCCPYPKAFVARGGCEFRRLPHSVARVRRVLAFKVLYAMFSSKGCW